MTIDFFPTKLATGQQFCNRVQEKALLQRNIDCVRHTVLVAPRRYGKSSLVLKVAEESTLPLASVDLFLAHDDMAITKRILTGISEAISQIMPIQQKMLKRLQHLFSQFGIVLTASGFRLELQGAVQQLDIVDQIYNALVGLDQLAQQQKQCILFFIDEFQDIREAKNAKAIQGAIRHVAQETQHIMFIFSGSNQRLLKGLFDDRAQPLYMLCDTMVLQRMLSKDYHPHLQALAKKQWHSPLPEGVFNKIMSLTERHPYYVNALCHELWQQQIMPEIEDVFRAWELCYEKHHDRLVAELEKLSVKQQDILRALAINPVSEPTGQHFVMVAQAAASTIKQSFQMLMQRDMVYRITQEDPVVPMVQKGQFRVLDPLLSFALRKYSD